MKIAIIGAGVIGVTTAHALSRLNCDVHVFEQGSSAAQGASFSQSGVLSPSQVSPVFAPHYAAQWLQSMLGQNKRFQWRLGYSSTSLTQHFKLLWAGRKTMSAAAYEQTTAQLKQLAHHSVSVQQVMLDDDAISYEHSRGVLVLYQKSATFEAASVLAVRANETIPQDSEKIKPLTVEQVLELEPALASHAPLVGGMFYPTELFGNCALFTKQLKQVQEGRVVYRFNSCVLGLDHQGGLWRLQVGDSHKYAANQTQASAHHALSTDEHLFDAVVIAAGQHSADLLHGVNIHYPVLKLHEYNVTLPIDHALDAPQHAIIDMQTGHSIVPIGTRVRVTGQYQMGGHARKHSTDYKLLSKTVQHWFPYASKVSEASYDCRTSTIAVDSKPIVGGTSLAGLYVNFAHGPHAWPLAFGSAQLLVHAMLSAQPSLLSKPKQTDQMPQALPGLPEALQSSHFCAARFV